jgi:hypothetical protein
VSPDNQSRVVYDFLHEKGLPPTAWRRPEEVPKTMWQDNYNTTEYAQKYQDQKDVSPDQQSRGVYEFIRDNVRPTAWERPDDVPKTMFQDYYNTTAYPQQTSNSKDVSPEF